MHTSVRRITYGVSAAIIAFAAYLSQLTLDETAGSANECPPQTSASTNAGTSAGHDPSNGCERGGKPGETPKD